MANFKNEFLDEEVGITEEELNQVKNLPDVILSAHVQKEQKKEKSPLIYKAEDLHSKRSKIFMKL